MILCLRTPASAVAEPRGDPVERVPILMPEVARIVPQALRCFVEVDVPLRQQERHTLHRAREQRMIGHAGQIFRGPADRGFHPADLFRCGTDLRANVLLIAGTAPHINNVELGKRGRYRTNVWSYAGRQPLWRRPG